MKLPKLDIKQVQNIPKTGYMKNVTQKWPKGDKNNHKELKNDYQQMQNGYKEI